MRSTAFAVLVVSALILSGRIQVGAQRGNPQPPRVAKVAAPIDLTGYWVSIVTMDWRFRMVTPAKGDYVGIPMTVESKKVADTWDPAKDEAAGEQCRSYGAPALMSVPGRVHITWQDDNTLKVDTDAGTQTRLFHFGTSPPARTTTTRTWQGESVAEWRIPRPPGGFGALLLRPAERSSDDKPPVPKGGTLKVVTTNLRPGYLRKNGVPYSANAVLTEYWDLYKRPNGEEWLTITTEIVDPQYLREPRLITWPFKKEPNGAKWDPSPCSSTW
jgi:hypothetical protein